MAEAQARIRTQRELRFEQIAIWGNAAAEHQPFARRKSLFAPRGGSGASSTFRPRTCDAPSPSAAHHRSLPRSRVLCSSASCNVQQQSQPQKQSQVYRNGVRRPFPQELPRSSSISSCGTSSSASSSCSDSGSVSSRSSSRYSSSSPSSPQEVPSSTAGPSSMVGARAGVVPVRAIPKPALHSSPLIDTKPSASSIITNSPTTSSSSSKTTAVRGRARSALAEEEGTGSGHMRGVVVGAEMRAGRAGTDAECRAKSFFEERSTPPEWGGLSSRRASVRILGRYNRSVKCRLPLFGARLGKGSR